MDGSITLEILGAILSVAAVVVAVLLYLLPRWLEKKRIQKRHVLRPKVVVKPYDPSPQYRVEMVFTLDNLISKTVTADVRYSEMNAQWDGDASPFMLELQRAPDPDSRIFVEPSSTHGSWVFDIPGNDSRYVRLRLHLRRAGPVKLRVCVFATGGFEGYGVATLGPYGVTLPPKGLNAVLEG